MLVNVPRLVSAYYAYKPDVTVREQRVAFGTSGHRGSSLSNSFNEDHILAVSQAICDYKQAQGYSGPLYIGIDSHALSEPAFISAVEVFAANGINLVIQQEMGYTPTPAISFAILTYNRGKNSGLADGVVITPSHNPPEDGGFKYNPPSAGPADTTTTKTIQDRANEILADGLKAVKRMSFEKALKADNVQEQDYIAPYVANLNTVIDMEAIAAQGLKTVLSNLSPDMVQAQEMAGEKIIAKLTRAPSNGAPIGGLKVVTANGWFAARPSGTENIYKVYAESFQGAEHLKAIQREAQAIVGAALVQAGVAKE